MNDNILERRERIALACLTGMLGDPSRGGSPADYVEAAIAHADLFIAALDSNNRITEGCDKGS